MAACQGGRLVVHFTNRKNAPSIFHMTRDATRAECAWVLWRQAYVIGRGGQILSPEGWSRVSATDQKSDCDRLRVVAAKTDAEQLQSQASSGMLWKLSPDTLAQWAACETLRKADT